MRGILNDIFSGIRKEIRCTNLPSYDELLQRSWDGMADNRLTVIVATIQYEQNEVIRASLTPIIVKELLEVVKQLQFSIGKIERFI